MNAHDLFKLGLKRWYMDTNKVSNINNNVFNVRLYKYFIQEVGICHV
jgi:hypothetical protein